MVDVFLDIATLVDRVERSLDIEGKPTKRTTEIIKSSMDHFFDYYDQISLKANIESIYIAGPEQLERFTKRILLCIEKDAMHLTSENEWKVLQEIRNGWGKWGIITGKSMKIVFGELLLLKEREIMEEMYNFYLLFLDEIRENLLFIISQIDEKLLSYSISHTLEIPLSEAGSVIPGKQDRTIKEIYDGLSFREKRLAAYIIQGLKTDAIALNIDRDPRTAQRQIEKLWIKFGCSNRSELSSLLLEAGISPSRQHH